MPIKAPRYPDAVEVTANLLRVALVAAGQAVHVGHEVPNPRPDRFVVVSRTGGVEVIRRLIDGAQITVDCWAPDAGAAMDLVQLCRQLLHQMPGTSPVHFVDEIGGPQDDPDPDSEVPRATQTFQVQIRGFAA